jgi:peptide/nickel transport system permease protein
MLKRLAPRLIGSVVLLIVVPTITFFLQGLAPTNVARVVLGLSASQAQVNAFNQRLGLNRPLVIRYFHWLAGAVHGDLGVSYTTGQSVTAILNPRLGISLSLIIGSLLVFTIVGILLGILSATGGRVVGKVVDGVSAFGIAIPNFWLAVILVTLFAVQIPLFPAIGYVPFSQGPRLWLGALVLPVVALAFGGITAVAKQTRDQMLLAAASPFTRTLRANGASEFSLIYKHALRNAAGPVVTVLGIIFVGALSGTVIIENIFVLPGLGSQALQSSLQSDLPVIQGIAVYFTVIVVIVNVLVDIASAILNPKVRAA